jgi:hypothetical protein
VKSAIPILGIFGLACLRRVSFFLQQHHHSLVLICVSSDPGDSKQAMFTGYNNKKRVNERYKIVGFISSGTYGRVYKAEGKNGRVGEFAIKKYVSICMFAVYCC